MNLPTEGEAPNQVARKVLICSKNSDWAGFWVNVLRAEGYFVVHFQTMPEAIANLRVNKYDLVILDPVARFGFNDGAPYRAEALELLRLAKEGGADRLIASAMNPAGLKEYYDYSTLVGLSTGMTNQDYQNVNVAINLMLRSNIDSPTPLR